MANSNSPAAHGPAPTATRGAILAAAAGALLIAAWILGGAGSAVAQDIDAEALAIERQLLCPSCVNLRLSSCELSLCDDMRALIREKLAAGESPDEIVDFFAGRYGDRVRANLPRSGFNLVLFGWVGGSILFVAVAGGAMLRRLRGLADSAAAAPGGDEQLADDRFELEEDRR